MSHSSQVREKRTSATIVSGTYAYSLHTEKIVTNTQVRDIKVVFFANFSSHKRLQIRISKASYKSFT